MTTYSNTPKCNVVMLHCNDISPKFAQFGVVSNDGDIKAGIDDMLTETVADQKHIYVSVLTSLMKYSTEELIFHKKNNTEEFINWCDDVLVFYVVRFTLMNKPIPINDDWVNMSPQAQQGGVEALLKNRNM